MVATEIILLVDENMGNTGSESNGGPANSRGANELLQENGAGEVLMINYEWQSVALDLTFAEDSTGNASALTPLDLPYLVLSPDALIPGETYDLSVEYWIGTRVAMLLYLISLRLRCQALMRESGVAL